MRQAQTLSKNVLQRTQEEACYEVPRRGDSERTFRRFVGLCARHTPRQLLVSPVRTYAEDSNALNSPSGHPYCLYGDPAYGLSDHFIYPYSAVTQRSLTPEMADFNKRMSQHCRVTVQWGFKEMTGKWAFVNVKTPPEPGRGAV